MTNGFSRRRLLQQGGLAAAACAIDPLLAFALQPNSNTVVNAPCGSLQGELVNGVRVFRGVPFAQPPVGPLRFKPPAPTAPWSGVREATVFAASAMQHLAAGTTLSVSEDCLYLNIWAPSGKGPFPVYVFIHGGSYSGGSATNPGFDGTVFARDGIVFVTVAYRLGVFGFTDLEPLLGKGYASSANNGIRDLVASLEWVNANIAAFGGDPSRVTIGGQSAGAKAVATLLAVPQANTLFRSGISESGGGERAFTKAEAAAVGEVFGEVWRKQQGAMESLRTAPAEAIVAAQDSFTAKLPYRAPFRPQIGADFLPARPVDVVAARSCKGRRLLIGTNRDEGASFIGPHPDVDPTSKNLSVMDGKRFAAVLAGYKTVYPEMSDAERRVLAYTAAEWMVHSVRFANAFTASGGDAWMYLVDYTEPSGRMAGEAFHGIEVPLVWERMDAGQKQDLTAAPLPREFHQAWVSFIKGNPPAAEGLPPWPRYDARTRSTMILDAQSKVEQRPEEAELRLWDGIF